MPTTVDIPGVGEVEFPDSMGPDEINAASAKLHQEHAGPKMPFASGEEGFKGALNAATGGIGPAVSEAAQGLSNPETPAEQSGRQALGVAGKLLPILGGAAGAAVAPPTALIAGTALSGLGAAGGEGYNQVIEHATGDPDAPQSGDEAAERMGMEGLVQGGLHAGTVGLSQAGGRFLGSKGLDNAVETVAQAKRTNVDPNSFTYSEASDRPSMMRVLRSYFNKTGVGRELESVRLRDAKAQIDAGKEVTRAEVKKPFDESVETAFSEGKTFDTAPIVKKAKEIRERLALEGSDKYLSPAAKKLLDRASDFDAVPQLRIGKNQFVKPADLKNFKLPSEPKQATPHEVRGLYTAVTGASKDSAHPDAQRIAHELKGAVREVDDQILPPGTRERYSQFKKDVGEGGRSSQTRSLYDKQAKETNMDSPSFWGWMTSVPKNAAAGGMHWMEKLPLETKIKIIENLSKGKPGHIGAAAIRALQMHSAYEGETGPYDAPKKKSDQ